MKKIFIMTMIMLLVISAVGASNNTIEINGVEFEIPSEYQGGDLDNDRYTLENIFSIECIDDKLAKSIGLWAAENDIEEDLTIDGHPVRHYCQYNEYVHANHSHAYFASNDSVYEIAWTGKDIDSNIEKLIKNTPKSNIDEYSFYSTLDESVDIYKLDRIDRLNEDGEYNYLETKLNSEQNQKSPDDTRFREILLTYYNR